MVAGEPTGSQPWSVQLDDALSCARCASGRDCQLVPPSRASLPIIACAGSGTLTPGDRVELEIEEHPGWLLPVALAYGLPTLGLLAGAQFGALAGLLGLAGGLLAWRAVDARRPCPGAACGAARIVTVVAEAATPIPPLRSETRHADSH